MIIFEDIVDVPITSNLLAVTKKRYVQMVFNSNTPLKKFGSENERTLAGYIGKEIVSQYLEIGISMEDVEYGLIYDDQKIDVKSITCKYQPTLDFLCTINSRFNSPMRHQLVNYYIFTRIHEEFERGWILGYIPCKEFWEIGTYRRKGAETISGSDFIKSDVTVIPIRNLYPMSDLFADAKNIITKKNNRL